jgi:hypothetical protein
MGVPGALEGVLGSSLLPGSFCITICVAFSSPFWRRNIAKIIPKQKTKTYSDKYETTYTSKSKDSIVSIVIGYGLDDHFESR